MKTIVFTHKAAKELDALPADARHSVTEALAPTRSMAAATSRRWSAAMAAGCGVGDYHVIFDDDGVYDFGDLRRTPGNDHLCEELK